MQKLGYRGILGYLYGLIPPCGVINVHRKTIKFHILYIFDNLNIRELEHIYITFFKYQVISMFFRRPCIQWSFSLSWFFAMSFDLFSNYIVHL